MKKIIALLLAMIMVMGLTTVVSADPYTDMEKVIIEKWYNNPNNGVSPAETFTFTHEKVGVTNAGVRDEATQEVVTKDTMPNLESVASVSFNEGDAGKVVISNSANYLCKREVVITLPEYEAVGIYEYKINEVKKDTAGVTYNTDDIKLIVTVVEQDGKVRVAAVHTESPADTNNEQGKKNNKLINIYESGTLAVSKKVTGNAGDLEKEFKVTVTFKAPEGEYVRAPITYVEEGVDKAIAATETAGWTGEKSVEIELKHDETITFKNIPEGVTYTVEEDSYASEGYDEAKYEFSDEAKKVDSVDGANNDTVLITNNKDIAVDTGIAMDSVPFIVMAVVAVLGLAAFTAKKRVQE